MTTIFNEGFDTGSAPWTFGYYSGSGASLDTANMLHGAGCLAINTSGTLSRLRINAGVLPTTGALYYRFYLKPTSTPSGTSYVMKRAAASNANLLQVAYNTTFQLGIRDNTGSQLGGSYTMTVNTWYRVEVLHDMSSAQMQLKVWSSVESTGAATFDSGLQTTTGTADLLTVGQDANITSSHLIDSFAISDSTWLGPDAGVTVSGSGAKVYVWNGSAWVSA